MNGLPQGRRGSLGECQVHRARCGSCSPAARNSLHAQSNFFHDLPSVPYCNDFPRIVGTDISWQKAESIPSQQLDTRSQRLQVLQDTATKVGAIKILETRTAGSNGRTCYFTQGDLQMVWMRVGREAHPAVYGRAAVWHAHQ